MKDVRDQFWQIFATCFGEVLYDSTGKSRTSGQILDEAIELASERHAAANLEIGPGWNTDMRTDLLLPFKQSGQPLLGWFSPMKGYIHDDLPGPSVMWWSRGPVGEQDGWSWHGAPMSRPSAWKPILPPEGGE